MPSLPAEETSSPSPFGFASVNAGLELATLMVLLSVNVFAAPSSGTIAGLTLRVVLLPSATAPPPVSPVPAVTVTDECCSMVLVTPALAMLNVPLVVIGPPVRPAPPPTLVTVPEPVPRVAQPHAVPLYCRI